MKFEELTNRIIGCAMKVQSVLGSGFTHFSPLLVFSPPACVN